MGSTPAVVAPAAVATPVAAAVEPPKVPEGPISEMPEEPVDGVEHIKVSFRTPSGQRVTRRFLSADKVGQMFHVASALCKCPADSIDLSTQFPKRALREIEGGLETLLKDAQVAGSMVT